MKMDRFLEAHVASTFLKDQANILRRLIEKRTKNESIDKEIWEFGMEMAIRDAEEYLKDIKDFVEDIKAERLAREKAE